MVSLAALVADIDTTLAVKGFKDYCPNGLQVEGSEEVSRIVTGVTASQDLIDAAIDFKADAILVHHGYFWQGEDPCVLGIKRRRLSALLANNISLLAYHLPLDAHPDLGNNVQLAKVFGWQPDDMSATENDFGVAKVPALIRTASLPTVMSGESLASHIGQCLDRKPLHISAARDIQRVAWCTGAAQSYLSTAIAMGVDAYITGEVSEQTVHEAREAGIHFYAAGHHATERYGVKALGESLAKKWKVESRFIDCDNPV